MTKGVAIDTLNQMLPHISDIVMAVDDDYRILYLNHSFPDAACQKFIGKSFLNIISPDFQDIFNTRVQQVIQSNHMDSLTYDYSENTVYRVKLIPFHESPKKNGVLMTFSLMNPMDRHEREKMGGSRFQFQKMEAIGSLATGIAHEFNNILWIMNSYIELAMGTIPDGDPSRYYLEQIEEAGLRARDLVAQIISFSRQSKQYYEPLKIDLVVKEILKLLKSSIPSTIKIKQHISIESGMVMADLAQINLLIMNICANAVYKMKNTGGFLEVSLVNIDLNEEDIHVHPELSTGRHVVLTIRDSGPGIENTENDMMNQIFEPLFSTKKNQFSTEMESSVINKIVKNHSGAISITRQPGKGNVFHIFIPCIKSDYLNRQYSAIIPTSRGNEYILFVDDERAIIEANQKLLERLGYVVITTTNSMEAYEIFRSNSEKLDLIVTDMTMPGLTGVELREKIHAIDPCIPIVLCTGYSSLITPEESIKLGFSEFLMKPISRNKMAEVIRNILDHHRLITHSD